MDASDYDQWMVPTYKPMLFTPARASGSRLWDTAGNEYIDLAGGIAVNALGHNHPELAAALHEQSQHFWHVSNLMVNPPALQLAKTLCERTFAEAVFFCNSGAEANEAALKLARRWHHDRGQRDQYEILAFDGAFHGRTLFTVSTGGQAKYTQGFGPIPEGIVHVPFNDLAAAERRASKRTAAIILEPIQGESGVIDADADFLRGIRALCDKYQSLLIFDEVQTGIGRTGELFAYMHTDVLPDILTSAKALGGGLPLGAMLTTKTLAQPLQPGTHGSTFGGNPLACAVANKVLTLIDDDLLQTVRQRSETLRRALQQLGDNLGLFREVRGQGLLLGAELNPAWSGRAADLVALAQQVGVLTLQAGDNVWRFAPALNITEEELQQAVQRLGDAVSKLV